MELFQTSYKGYILKKRGIASNVSKIDSMSQNGVYALPSLLFIFVCLAGTVLCWIRFYTYLSWLFVLIDFVKTIVNTCSGNFYVFGIMGGHRQVVQWMYDRDGAFWCFGLAMHMHEFHCVVNSEMK